MASDPAVVRREYGLSHADLRRILPRLTDASFASAEDYFSLEFADGRRVCLTVSPERERRLGLLRLPVVDIAFSFEGTAWVETECAAFLRHFDRAFQKGGG